MPIYVFQCQSKKCQEVYEVLTKYDKTGKYKSVQCPHCKSKKKKQVAHNISFQFTNPEGTDLWRSSHDYRYQHKLPKAKAERANAEKASKMGSSPYNSIDDLNSGNNFGSVN
jgi:putative FmdB family regulatory protein